MSCRSTSICSLDLLPPAELHQHHHHRYHPQQHSAKGDSRPDIAPDGVMALPDHIGMTCAGTGQKLQMSGVCSVKESWVRIPLTMPRRLHKGLKALHALSASFAFCACFPSSLHHGRTKGPSAGSAPSPHSTQSKQHQTRPNRPKEVNAKAKVKRQVQKATRQALDSVLSVRWQRVAAHITAMNAVPAGHGRRGPFFHGRFGAGADLRLTLSLDMAPPGDGQAV